MSVGPKEKSERLETPASVKIRYAVKRTTKEYFNDPIHYLLYGSLTFAIIGLTIGRRFPWEFYALIAIFATVEFYKKTHPVVEEKKDGQMD